ncbi:MAG: Os1348 family NHLP clan protein [Geobacteraceae bacterium]|nr:Os1348 family NHLP clan protein [Geobacteraceae bacterium]
MSQEVVERVIGRLITDERFRHLANHSMEEASLLEGYLLTPTEVQLLSGLAFPSVTKFAKQLNPGLCRVGSPDKTKNVP